MIVGLGGQIVVMGRGEAHFEEAMQVAQSRHPKSIAVAIRYDEGEARRIFAGSDFTLMPSRFEPCGLAQMYAQRFGSLPIGRNTGGLSETIADGATGFLFEQASALSFLGGVCRAFSTYRSQRRLNKMREGAMAKSYSWSMPARAYGGLYRNAIAKAA
jgi:starch synthase